MATYWLSFRLDDSRPRGRATYDDRYADFVSAVYEHANPDMLWEETTSFYIFESSSALHSIARALKAAIDPDLDIFVLRSLDVQRAIACGAADDEKLSALMPYLRKI